MIGTNWILAFMAVIFLTAGDTKAQTCNIDALSGNCTSSGGEACACPAECPEPGYTNCNSAWGAPQSRITSLYIPDLGMNCDIEIHYCCRIRELQYPKFVLGPVAASCEMAITCIRIPKACVASRTGVGQPTEPDVRYSIYTAVLNDLICANVCGMGLPETGNPYEWVFSMPACLCFTKTGGQHSAFCLVSCGNRYCVYAYRVIMAPGGGPRVLEEVNTEWKPANEDPACDSTPCCVYDPCTDYRPNCSEWVWDIP